ncbi:MAG TPA: hypothetical protein VJB95_02465 [Candidatus Paceibacterota bacterium]
MKENAPGSKNINRPNFFKKIKTAGTILGITAILGGAAGVGVKLGKANLEESLAHEKIDEAEVLEKMEVSDGWKTTNIHLDPIAQITPGLFQGGGMKAVPVGPVFAARLKVAGQETKVLLTQKHFDEYKVGQKIKVKYDERTMEVLDILD